jgi:hypothetical protein
MEEENFGEWSIDYEVFIWLRHNIPSRTNIIELGSGQASATLAKYWRVYSIEHDSRFIGLVGSPNLKYIYAPIKNSWYDPEVIRQNLPEAYSCIIIDGPPGVIGRYGFIENIDLWNLDVPIIVDDLHRKDEMKIFHQLEKNYWPYRYSNSNRK